MRRAFCCPNLIFIALCYAMPFALSLIPARTLPVALCPHWPAAVPFFGQNLDHHIFPNFLTSILWCIIPVQDMGGAPMSYWSASSSFTPFCFFAKERNAPITQTWTSLPYLFWETYLGLALLLLLLHLVFNELLGWNRERHELESNVESFVLSKTMGSDRPECPCRRRAGDLLRVSF